MSVSVAVGLPVPQVAVSVMLVLTLTTEVVIEKDAAIEPAGTNTVGGTFASAVLLLERLTTSPPAGAGPLRVTVAAEATPP